MPSLSPIDSRLLQIVTASPPSSIAEVIAMMQQIDGLLPGSDGLKWFNRLYLIVTQKIDGQPPAVWNNAPWLTHLDIVFAQFYFAAVAGALEQSSRTASSWDALFEVGHKAGIDRIQFGLAGMNAHINHDLALALVETNEELKMAPQLISPEHDDFDHVNVLLSALVPSALSFLATGSLGEIAQDTGKIGRLLAIWDVAAARELAWDFGGHLRILGSGGRKLALDAQDKLTGVIGRSLLLPI